MPCYEWLGFPHDQSDDETPCQDLEDYARKRHWPTIDKVLMFADPAATRTVIEGDGEDYELFMINFIGFCQSWLYMGVMETCLQVKVKQSFLTRRIAKDREIGALEAAYGKTLNNVEIVMKKDILISDARRKLRKLWAPIQKFKSVFLKDASRPERHMLHSRLLTYALWKREQELQKLDPELRAEAQSSIDLCLFKANTLMSYWTVLAQKLLDHEEECERGLGRLIIAMMRVCAPLVESVSQALQATSNSSRIDAKWLKLPKKDLVLRNWCPHLLSWLGHLGASCIEWLVASGMTGGMNQHTKCDGETCIEYKVDLESYRSLHQMHDCSCRPLIPDLSEVSRALLNGKIPVMRLSKCGSGIEVLAHDVLNATAKYVAFSHVWSHGLGSSTEKGLPLCQIQRLAKLSISATGDREIYFWIDSLSIPQNLKLRKEAILLLRDTYRQSLKTVVLDRTVSRIRIREPWSHRAWAIISSAWMQRLWTFEEAVLSKSLVFEAKDGFIYPQLLISELIELESMYIVAYRFLSVLVDILDPSSPRASNFDIRSIMAHLQFRSTNKSSDEILSLIGLLNLPMRHLYDFHGEEIWMRFYLQVAKLPWDIVFDARPKIKASPFKWAPSTFLHRSTYVPFYDLVADCCESGLKVEMSVLQLDRAVSLTEFLDALQLNSEFFGVRGVSFICRVETCEPTKHFLLFLTHLEGSTLEEAKFDGIIPRKIDHEESILSSMAREKTLMTVGVKRQQEVDSFPGLPVWEVTLAVGPRFFITPESEYDFVGINFSLIPSIKGTWIEGEVLLI